MSADSSDPPTADGRAAKKRHHFVPVTYLDGFTKGGRLQVYMCDRPGPPLSLAPENIAYRNYYYSQPIPDGGRDNDRIENLFDNEVETHWPEAKAAAREDRLTPELWARLYLMLASLRARVPATREMIETALAAQVRVAHDKLEAAGRLPPKPQILQGDFWDKVHLSIDPHQSMHAMPQILESVNWVQQAVGFEILHNRTDRPFITSDNPVAWYDPTVPAAQRRPYKLDRTTMRTELIFPIDAWTLLRGTNVLKRRQAGGPPLSRDVTDEAVVRRLNRVTAQYAYRLAFGQDSSSERLIRHFAETSPVLRSTTHPVPKGVILWMDMVFGSRPSLPKWQSEATWSGHAKGPQ